jgi:ABC-type multidrug transport system fused ATPase/permease subunit
MVGALTVDVGDCSYAYMKVVDMFRLLVEVGLSIYFTLQNNPDTWWAAVSVPVVMLLWGCCRTRVFFQASEEVGEKELSCISLVNETLAKLSLVADYQQRPQMNDIFADRAEQFRTAQVREHHVTLTNKFIPKFLGPALVALYTVLSARLVLTGKLRLGIFLATVKIFGSICGAFSECFGLVMEVLGTLPALKGVFVLLNMPTDVPGLGRSNDARMQMTHERRQKLPDHESVPKTDRLQIELVDLEFSHGSGKPVLKSLNLACPQGKLCKIVAKSGSGTQTIMQLLAMRHFPTWGTLFVPSHLRIIYVPHEIFLLNMSIWDNLTFGNREGNNPYRVEKILRYFGMEAVESMCKSTIEMRKRAFNREGTAALHDEESCEGNPQTVLESLRESEQYFINVVRAFVTNPEVLVLHRPFMRVRKGVMREKTARSLQLHRDHRGFCMPLESSSHRRPRTIFYSSDENDLNIADWCWELPEEIGGDGKYYAVSHGAGSSSNETANQPLANQETTQVEHHSSMQWKNVQVDGSNEADAVKRTLIKTIHDFDLRGVKVKGIV